MDGIIIYRGTNQIGGIVTEFRKDDHRIVIDFGANLPGTKDAKISDEELVKQVFGEKSDGVHTDAVLFTHYHGDHVGLKRFVPEGIPMYIGPTAREIMKIIAGDVDFIRRKKGLVDEIELPTIERMKPYWKLGTPRDFHGIWVTPLVCDHSALDAYMYVIEINGKRILYTGDFRDHGIPGEDTFEKMLRTYVGKIDILVTEGTMVSRIHEEHKNPVHTEAQLGKRAEEIFSTHKENVVLVSSTNLDSIMEFYHATPKEKAFLCDPYQARVISVAIRARHKFFPDKYSYHKPIYVLCPDEDPRYARELLGDSFAGAGLLRPFGVAKASIYTGTGFVMLARPNHNPDVEIGKFEKHLSHMTDPFITYSMWTGYLKGGKAEEPAVVKFMDGFMDADHMEVLHTSGHAYVETLEKLMDMTKPEVIIPMHTECRDSFGKIESFSTYRDRLHPIEDGCVYEL